MTRREIERFFSALARSWPHPTECILIGGAAAALEGGGRPTADVDFEARLGGGASVNDADIFAGAVRFAEAASGLSGQFTEDLSAWSPVAMPPYRARKRLWKAFGPVRVYLLAPSDYIVSKLRRGAAHDFTDLLLVCRAHRVPWRLLAVRCGMAVRASPKSTRLVSFMKRAEYLFRRYGHSLWGRGFDPESAVGLFRKTLSARR